jgi:hypothetical protein
MGHAHGLGHSFRTNPDTEYGDPYDIMSVFTNYYPFNGPYGESGPGLVAPQVDHLGALPGNRVEQLGKNVATRLTLAALNVPAAAGFLAVRFSADPAQPCEQQQMFEFRRKAGWDRGIPADVVVAHKVRNGVSFLLSGSNTPGLAVGDTITTLRPEIHALVEGIDANASTATVRFWSFANGDVRKEDSSTDMYLMWGGARWPIASVAELEDLGYLPGDVGWVPDGSITALPTIPRDQTWLVEDSPLALINRDIYVIHHGRKRKLAMSIIDAFAQFGFNLADIGVVPPGALSHIPNGPLLIAGRKLTSLGPSDLNGDTRSDYVVWRPSTQEWFVKRSSSGSTYSLVWGEGGDVPLLGDFNRDGWDDITIWRPSTGAWWFSPYPVVTPVANSPVPWGVAGDLPVPGDYDGDGRCDLAVFRPYEGNWYLRSSATDRVRVITFGNPGDLPVPADYDGDGSCDLAVWRPSANTWFIRQSKNCAVSNVVVGEPTDIPVPADYDGDGKAEIALFRPRDGTWHLRSPAGAMRTFQWGRTGDIPVPGDFDGDGMADIAVWRPADGTWYILPSSANYDGQHALAIQFGQGGDIPVLGPPWIATRA